MTPRRFISILLSALILAAAYYLYFVLSVQVNTLEYRGVPYVNNYPQPKEANDIFLGDRFLISVEIKNNGLRRYSNLPLTLRLSRAMTIIAINNVPTTAFEKGCYPDSCDAKDLTLTIDNIGPFEHRIETLTMSSFQAGFLNVTASLDSISAENPDAYKQMLELQIKPRPTSPTPQVPSDIISYLGDKARDNCQKLYPCPLDSAGRCPSYPFSPQSRKCLIDENQKLFSGCGEPPRGADSADEWQGCLMKRYGFPILSQ